MKMPASIKEKWDRVSRWLFDPFKEPESVGNPYFSDTEPGYKKPERIFHGRLADPEYRESLEFERHAEFLDKSLAKGESEPEFTGGLAPTAWDDMELEQSITFSSPLSDDPDDAEIIGYNPLHPETVDDLLSDSGTPEAPAATQEFSDEVLIITEKPRPETPPLLENYMNM